MKKNGFIATALIYTFFILFLSLMLYLLNSYTNRRYLLEEYKSDIKKSFKEYKKQDLNIHLLVFNEVTKEYDELKSLEDGLVLENNYSDCENGSTITYENGEIIVMALGQDTCYIRFRKE